MGDKKMMFDWEEGDFYKEPKMSAVCNYCGNSEHSESSATCPVLKAAFCSVCNKYGHFFEECKNSTAIFYREPVFLEQLIPYSVRVSYGIESKTEIRYSDGEKTAYEEIGDIKKALEDRGIAVGKSIDENRRRIERWGIENGKIIRYKKNGRLK